MQGLTVAFHDPVICIRGSSVALYDYADHNEKILGNRSIILTPADGLQKADPLGVNKYIARFQIFVYQNKEDMEAILQEEKCSVLYCIKYGKNDGFYSEKTKTVVHCVFDMSEPHGNVYAGVSKTLAEKYGKKEFVPHMVSLVPSVTRANLRETLRIPEEAIVFGRYGGMDTFNIRFCWDVISKVLKDRKDIYFLFINTPREVVHDRVIHLPKISSDTEKNLFICTCDAHLECGTMGHTFGLAMGEFSVNNKPIIAYGGPTWNNAHKEILGNNAIYFQTPEDFEKILREFTPSDYNGKDLNFYKEYSPENVMKQFQDVFLA